MNGMPSPASFLPEGALDTIREYAASAEFHRDLAPETLELIYREGWFRLLVPRRWGGKAMALPQLVRLEEGLAFADGSVGWVVTLCSGAGWFAGFLPEDLGDQVFTGQQLCIAGSGSITGEAHVVDGGYRVRGNWAYASGIRHATAYSANCVIWNGGMPSKDEEGKPVVRPFIFLPGEVRVHNDWNAMGLVATGSHGFSVEGLTVAAERAFAIDPAAATDGDVLYRYPFRPLAEVTLAANISGMGRHFLDCCSEYFKRREMPEALGLLTRARAETAAARSDMYRILDSSWELMKKELVPAEVFGGISRTTHVLAAKVREWVDQLYPYAGLGAARADSEINRVWRDLHTAGQHPVLVFDHC